MARPNEVKAVVALLMEPADDVTALAKQIINRVDELRQDRTDYIACVQAGGLANGYGPFATYNQAAEVIIGGKLPAVDGSRFFIMPLRSLHHAEQAFAKADEGGVSEEAARMWEIARNGGQKARTRGGRKGRAA